MDISFRTRILAIVLFTGVFGCTRTSVPDPVTANSKPPADHPYVAHAYQCRGCHEPQYDFWAKTKHAAAYLVLFAKDAHFNWECIGCHSVGFEDPGGFSRIAHPIVLDDLTKDPKDKPFVETLMKKVFGDELKKGPLDSRVQPARFEKLHRRYDEEIKKLEQAGQIKKLYIGVQCENCHGNRDEHVRLSVPGQKRVKESTCRTCHAPPNAPNFTADMIPKVACPLMVKK
jgi:hypothetical protein